MSCYNPNCCDETNPNCCEICNCLNFTSSNNTVDVGKTGCKVDVRITNNILDGLLSIPSSGCISIVKEYINGKLVFTPTLNLQCIQDLIPAPPVIPDVPVYTADNGIKLNTYNFELGANPLLHDTDIPLGAPDAPFSLRIFQNDPSNSSPILEQHTGNISGQTKSTSEIKSGITDVDTLTHQEQDEKHILKYTCSVKNKVTDISFYANSYSELNNDGVAILGVKYPTTLNNITNALPSIDADITTFVKMIGGRLDLYGKNIILSNDSPTSALIEQSVLGGVSILQSTNGSGTWYTVTPNSGGTDSLLWCVPGLVSFSTYIGTERDTGAYYSHTMIVGDGRTVDDPYVRLGVYCPDTTDVIFTQPPNDVNKTSYTIYRKRLATTFATAILNNGKVLIADQSSVPYDTVDAVVPSASLEIRSSKGGLLLPRMSTADRNNIPSPVAGLQVYDLDFAATLTFDGVRWTGFRYNSGILAFEGFNGTTWRAFCMCDTNATPQTSITGTINNAAKGITVNISQSIPCGVSLPIDFTYDDNGTPTAGNATVTILAGNTSGSNATASQNTITCIKPTTAGGTVYNFSQICSGIEYNFSLTITNPC